MTDPLVGRTPDMRRRGRSGGLMRHPLKLGVVVAMVVLVAVLVVVLGPRASEGAAADRAVTPPVVGVVTVKEEVVVLTSELPGRVVAQEVSEVRPQINGVIRQRLFEEGAEVRQGQLLYVVEDAPYRAAVAAAEGRLAEARAMIQSTRAQAERYDQLADVDAVSRQETELASAAFAQAQASVQAQQGALDAARANLAFTRIRAPISGRIGRSNSTVGALVQIGQPMALAQITRTDVVYVDVSQSAGDLLDLRDNYEAGQLTRGRSGALDVRLVLPNGQDFGRQGTLRFSDTVVDPTTGAVALRAVFANPDGRLMPGMSVRTILTEGSQNRAILVPQPAVTRDKSGQAQVLIVGAGNRLELRPVVANRAIGDRWLVAQGLSTGDRVVVDGLTTARPGLVITPAAPQRVASSPARSAGQGAGQ